MSSPKHPWNRKQNKQKHHTHTQKHTSQFKLAILRQIWDFSLLFLFACVCVCGVYICVWHSGGTCACTYMAHTCEDLPSLISILHNWGSLVIPGAYWFCWSICLLYCPSLPNASIISRLPQPPHICVGAGDLNWSSCLHEHEPIFPTCDFVFSYLLCMIWGSNMGAICTYVLGVPVSLSP